MLHACQTTSHYRVTFETVRACMEKWVTRCVFCGGLSSDFKKGMKDFAQRSQYTYLWYDVRLKEVLTFGMISLALCQQWPTGEVAGIVSSGAAKQRGSLGEFKRKLKYSAMLFYADVPRCFF